MKRSKDPKPKKKVPDEKPIVWITHDRRYLTIVWE